MAQLYPLNPNTAQRVQGSSSTVPPLDMAFETQLSKACKALDGDYLISQQALANGATTDVAWVTGQDEVQSLARGSASAGSFNFKFAGENYAGGTNAVWKVDVGDSTGGTFTLTFYGQTTSAIAWNASPNVGGASVQTLLAALSTVGTGNVTVTGVGSVGSPFVITFTADLGSVPVTLTASGASLTGNAHTLTISSFVTGVGIAYNVLAADFQLALETLTAVAVGDIVVTGTTVLTLTFASLLANVSQPLITVPKDVTTGGTGIVISRTTHGNGQPDVARNATIVANVAGVVGNVVVTGKDLANATITDTIALNGITTVQGVKAFKSITTVQFPARTHVGDTVDIGIGNKLGLHHKLTHNTVLAAHLNNVLEGTAPTVATSSSVLSQNTALLNSALVEGQTVDVYYLV